MTKNVLVLNQDFSPLTICSTERAFLLIYGQKADMVNACEGKFIRSISKAFPLPSVIRLNRYIHIPYKSVVMTRHNIFKRDQYQCQYCGTPHDLTLDHLIPKSKGGKTNWTNLVTACKTCNSKKGDFLIHEIDELKLNKIPVKPSFIMFLKNNTGSNDDWLPYLEPKAYA